jgi:hypothetical protein
MRHSQNCPPLPMTITQIIQRENKVFQCRHDSFLMRGVSRQTERGAKLWLDSIRLYARIIRKCAIVFSDGVYALCSVFVCDFSYGVLKFIY